MWNRFHIKFHPFFLGAAYLRWLNQSYSCLISHYLPEYSLPPGKTSYIHPIYESGHKAKMQNYRPISILPTLTKVFESIVTSRLSDFFLLSISDSQHGFVKGRSVLPKFSIYNYLIFDSFKSRSQVDFVYFDFSEAFDTVNHDRLLEKVWNAGIRGHPA